jgi:hypothetical protein
MEAIQGAQKIVSFDRISVCTTCHGSKCKPGSSPSVCTSCGGSGQVMYKQGFMSIAMPCNGCNGEGSTIRNPCLTCYGKGYTNISVKENINIPKGVDDNMNLRMQKKVYYSIYFRDIILLMANMAIYMSKLKLNLTHISKESNSIFILLTLLLSRKLYSALKLKLRLYMEMFRLMLIQELMMVILKNY